MAMSPIRVSRCKRFDPTSQSFGVWRTVQRLRGQGLVFGRRRSRQGRDGGSRVSFEADPDENSTYYSADHFVVHPDWLANEVGPGGGNSKKSFLKDGLEDIALVARPQRHDHLLSRVVLGPQRCL
jgi:hypothetical protein